MAFFWYSSLTQSRSNYISSLGTLFNSTSHLNKNLIDIFLILCDTHNNFTNRNSYLLNSLYIQFKQPGQLQLSQVLILSQWTTILIKRILLPLNHLIILNTYLLTSSQDSGAVIILMNN